MGRFTAFLLILVVVCGVVAANAFFIVNEREQALVLRFGEPRRTIETPGLNFKIPVA